MTTKPLISLYFRNFRSHHGNPAYRTPKSRKDAVDYPLLIRPSDSLDLARAGDAREMVLPTMIHQ